MKKILFLILIPLSNFFFLGIVHSQTQKGINEVFVNNLSKIKKPRCVETPNDCIGYGKTDNALYLGEWKERKFDGYGIYISPDIKYLGQWKSGEWHGIGMFFLAPGISYYGSFINNKREGRGVSISPSGVVTHGIWSNGELIKSTLPEMSEVELNFFSLEHSRLRKIWKSTSEKHRIKESLADTDNLRKLWTDISTSQIAESTQKINKSVVEKKNDKITDDPFSINVKYGEANADGILLIEVKATKPVTSLKVDDMEYGGSADGNYILNKLIYAGLKKTFEVIAIDEDGNRANKSITVNRPVIDSKPAIALLNPTKIKRQPERDAVAIIIGIADYKNLPRADYANDDARVFYDYAVRALGVKPENIKLLVDADADEVGIYRAFKTWLPSQVRASTDVYVYYSGHGLPTADGQGLYVLPQRADRDFMDKTAITQAEINAAIQAAKPKSVTVFLDACYSGQARTGETLLASARPVSLKAETAAFPEGFTVITASRGDQISSSSPELKHGIFSYYLMRGMEGDADANRDGRITAGEMQAYLAENVSRQAGMMNRRQEPQLIGDSNKVLVGR